MYDNQIVTKGISTAALSLTFPLSLSAVTIGLVSKTGNILMLHACCTKQ